MHKIEFLIKLDWLSCLVERTGLVSGTPKVYKLSSLFTF
jgi:hypothetical protein